MEVKSPHFMPVGTEALREFQYQELVLEPMLLVYQRVA